MELKIAYRDGSIRLVRPTDAFINDSADAIKKKVESFSFDTGIAHTADLFVSENATVELKYDWNKPQEHQLPNPKKLQVDRAVRRTLLAKHKKSLLNPTFTEVTLNGKSRTFADIKAQRKAIRNRYKLVA